MNDIEVEKSKINCDSSENKSTLRNIRLCNWEFEGGDVCGKKLTRSNLARHMNIHKNVRPFNCSICDKAFRAKSNLNEHMRIHNDERPFHCSFCKMTFRQKTHLQMHDIKTHRGRDETNVKAMDHVFVCRECDFSSSDESDLKRHKRAKHSKMKCHVCKECGSAFALRFQLEIH